MSKFDAAVGIRIKEKRKEKHYSRERLARISEISDKFLYEVEVGHKGVSADNLKKLRNALGVTADWLLDGDEEPKA